MKTNETLHKYFTFLKEISKSAPFFQQKLIDFYKSVPDGIKKCYEEEFFTDKQFYVNDRLWLFDEIFGFVVISDYCNSHDMRPGDREISIINKISDVKKMEEGEISFLIEYKEVTFVAKTKDGVSIPNFDEYRISVKRIKENKYEFLILTIDPNKEIMLVGKQILNIEDAKKDESNLTK